MSRLVANEYEQHQSVVDGYSIGKFATGALVGISAVSETAFMVGALVFEGIQNGTWFERTTPPESPMNQLGDVAFSLAGFAVGSWIRKNKPQWISAMIRLMDPEATE